MVEPENCNHPRERRFNDQAVIRGTRVEVEVCGVCGLRLVRPADTERLLSTEGRLKRKGLSPSETVLALLGAQPRPIYDRIVLMKEAFLTEKELSEEIELAVEPMRWIPHKYGPYSKRVDDALRELAKQAWVRIEKDAQGQKETLTLTDKGEKEAAAVLSRLEDAQRKRLAEKRRAWDQLGYRGILEKVYRDYPAYKSKSEIADEVQPSRRWV